MKEAAMETLLVDTNSVQAQNFISYAKTLAFVKSVPVPIAQPLKDFYRAAQACNATSVDDFFDEVDNRIKKHFRNV